MSFHKRSHLLTLVGLAAVSLTIIGCSQSSRKLDTVLWVGGFAHDYDAIGRIMTESLPTHVPMDIRLVRDGSFLDDIDDNPPDVILMNNCYRALEDEKTGKLIITESQRKKLLDLVRGGLGVVAVHASYYSFPDEQWNEFHELFGSRFIKHGSSKALLQVNTVDKSHPIMEDLADSFEIVSELYESQPLPDDCHVLARSREKGTDNVHPSVWTRMYGQGRVVTVLPGHWPDSYRIEGFQELIVASAKWVAYRID